ncbi:unnamed protein product [Lampetra fluviatilis]
MARRPRRRSRRPGSSANAKIDDVNGNSLVGGRARPSQPWPTINTVQRQRRSDFKHGNTGARPRRKSIPRHNPEGDGNSRRVPARTQAGVDPDSSTRATDGGGGDARGLLVQRRGGSERRWIVAHLSRSSLPLRVVNVPLAGSPGRMQELHTGASVRTAGGLCPEREGAKLGHEGCHRFATRGGRVVTMSRRPRSKAARERRTLPRQPFKRSSPSFGGRPSESDRAEPWHRCLPQAHAIIPLPGGPLAIVSLATFATATPCPCLGAPGSTPQGRRFAVAPQHLPAPWAAGALLSWPS